MTLFILIMLVILLGVDTACEMILEKAIPTHKNERKKFIPGYNIYIYYRWKREIKQ